jgi:hypothetical protein
MATYQRPPTNPVVDAQRGSRWPIFLFVVVAVLAVGGGVAYDRYVANAPIVLTPTRPSEPPTTTTPGRPSQSTSPSTQPTRPGQTKPTQSARGAPDWMPFVMGLIPVVVGGVILLIVITWVRRLRRAAMDQVRTANPAGHWAGGQHSSTGAAAAGPWARQPGATASPVATPTASSQPVKRKGGGFPLLPIIIGAIVLDQAVFNGRYSREALAWITKIIEEFSR